MGNADRNIQLLRLAEAWAHDSGVHSERVLRNLCDWVVSGVLPPHALVTVDGDRIDPPDIFMSRKVVGASCLALSDRTPYSARWGAGLLAAVYVSEEGVRILCKRTGTALPSSFQRGLERFFPGWRAKHQVPPACPDAELFAARHEARLSAEGRINFLRDLLARLMERRIRHSLLDRVDLATSLEMDRREWESGRAGLERDLERCGDVHLQRAFEALAVQFADAVAKLKDENLVAARAGQATGPDRSAGEFSQQELRNWYGSYLANKKALGESPSRDDDWEAAKRALGEGIPREKVWALRTELAPDAWKRAGRRKSSPGRPDKA
jgi:hypothetical protein